MNNAESRMTRARTRLMLDNPWFGSLAMRLDLISVTSQSACPTMQTNGSVIQYSPEFVMKQTDAHLIGILAHEVLHCALLHPYRRGSRDKDNWNKACDYAINLDLTKAGFTLPPDCLLDQQYAGMSADVIYAKLSAKPKDDNGQAPPPPPSTGTVEDAPKDAQGQGQGTKPGKGQATPGQGMTEEDWKIATDQATSVTKACGNTPADAVRSAKAARQVPEDWRAILREFIEHQTPSDYSWSSPNRRYIADGLYLPGIVKENLGYIGVAIDTSGSISTATLSAFAQELTAIVQEARPERVQVVYCDSTVKHTQDFSPDDLQIDLDAKGGGGTRFTPALNHFERQDDAPLAVLYFTDLENFGEVLTPSPFPVLWVTGKNVTKPAPFGQLIRIDAHV